MPCVLQDEEDCNLVPHLPPRWEWYAGLQAEELSHGVEEPNLRKLDGEVGEEDEFGATPLFR